MGQFAVLTTAATSLPYIFLVLNLHRCFLQEAEKLCEREDEDVNVNFSDKEVYIPNRVLIITCITHFGSFNAFGTF